MNLHQIAQGYLVTLGLIVAIGAQNAHVLRMGLTRQHVLITVLVCTVSDALLMGLGVSGMGAVMTRFPRAVEAATWCGAAFLLWYGLRSLRAAFAERVLVPGEAAPMPARQAVLLALGFTYLNPHAWLDTVVLVGALGGREQGPGRLAFWIGCVAASISWFMLLGYGARWLAPLFRRAVSWRVLDALVGVGMGALALALVR